jgi:Cu+-exporting ATPase
MKQEKYEITGMHCAACSASVEKVTRRLPGVERSDVNLTTGVMEIVYDEKQVAPELICQKVEKAGFGISKKEEHPAEKAEREKARRASDAVEAQKKRLIGAAVFSVVLLYVSMGQMLPTPPLPLPDLFSMMSHPVNFAVAQLVLTIPVLSSAAAICWGALPPFPSEIPTWTPWWPSAAPAPFAYSLVMTFLITDTPHHVHHLYYESAAVVLTLIMLGKFFEARSVQKTKGAVTALLALQPDTAVLAESGGRCPPLP